jgi:macrolide-specific efflux system membrane fusion protein
MTVANKRFPTTKILVFLLLLAGIGGGAWYFKNAKGDAANSASGQTTISVIRGNIEDVVTAQGKLEPRDYVDVGAQVSGQLKTLHVDIGAVVKKGDLLAEIDPEIYVAQVKANEAKLKTMQAQQSQQEAQVAVAQKKYNRNKTLIKSNAVSQEVFEDADTDLKVAKAQLESTKAQIEEAQSTLEGDKAKLGYASIYAPMDGTVVAQSAKEGQTLNANQSAPVIMQLADLDTMTVRAQVAEADVMRLKTGLPVYFTTLGSQDRKWNGTVRQILPTPETVNDVVLYNVLVDVDNKDRQLMTGMSTQMFFVMDKAENVLVIPVSALGKRMAKEDNEQGLAYRVRVVTGKSTVEKVIHVGLMDRTKAEVKVGLGENDQLSVAAPAPSASSSAQGGRRGMGPRL